jgi:hypothetical protein
MMCRRRRRISFRLRRHSGSEIVRLWWTNPSTGNTGNNTRAEIVDWIENQDGEACHFTRQSLPQSDIGGKNCSGPRYRYRTHLSHTQFENLHCQPIMTNYVPIHFRDASASEPSLALLIHQFATPRVAQRLARAPVGGG